jgi:prepilin-type N-terminal cleavage/methylation domain-containing protein
MTSNRPGFTLFEVVVVMFLLGTLMLLVGAVLVGAFQTERLANHITQRQAGQEALADQFRHDVATARAAPDKGKEWTAGPAVLILRLDDTRHVVYRWDAGRLQRTESGGAIPLARHMPLGGESFRVEFARSGGEHPIVSLKIIETRRGVDQSPLEIMAALGGDLR